jgi:hypothetical protein
VCKRKNEKRCDELGFVRCEPAFLLLRGKLQVGDGGHGDGADGNEHRRGAIALVERQRVQASLAADFLGAARAEQVGVASDHRDAAGGRAPDALGIGSAGRALAFGVFGLARLLEVVEALLGVLNLRLAGAARLGVLDARTGHAGSGDIGHVGNGAELAAGDLAAVGARLGLGARLWHLGGGGRRAAASGAGAARGGSGVTTSRSRGAIGRLIELVLDDLGEARIVVFLAVQVEQRRVGGARRQVVGAVALQRVARRFAHLLHRRLGIVAARLAADGARREAGHLRDALGVRRLLALLAARLRLHKNKTTVCVCVCVRKRARHIDRSQNTLHSRRTLAPGRRAERAPAVAARRSAGCWPGRTPTIWQ